MAFSEDIDEARGTVIGTCQHFHRSVDTADGDAAELECRAWHTCLQREAAAAAIAEWVQCQVMHQEDQHLT